MFFRPLFLLLAVWCLNRGAAADGGVSKADIESWWKAGGGERIKVDRELVKVRLRSKEVAYLTAVGFYDRGRNDTWQTVLVRPTLKQVEELPEPFGGTFEVHDLDHDGISEVVSISVGSGQGTESGTRAIVHIDGWEPEVLHTAEFFEGCAFIGQTMRCSSRKVNWKFVDLDGDGGDDLLEEIEFLRDSLADKPAKASRVVKRLLFKEGAFVPYGQTKRGRQRKVDG
jgi:hypothetical protein